MNEKAASGGGKARILRLAPVALQTPVFLKIPDRLEL